MNKLKKIFKKHGCKQDFGSYGMGVNSLEGDLYEYIQDLKKQIDSLKTDISGLIPFAEECEIDQASIDYYRKISKRK